MTRVMLVQPWFLQDVNVKRHNLTYEWRNGPYSLLLLATILKNAGHEVVIIDLSQGLVTCHGDVNTCTRIFKDIVVSQQPDVIGFGFFSCHRPVVRQLVYEIKSLRLKTTIVAGGIHATIMPSELLEFDYVFEGEADNSLLEFVNGKRFEKNKMVDNLDSLPFPDWSLIDWKFYSTPSYARARTFKTSSLDMLMGRGCVYKCNFCAYSALSKVRFYSCDYLIEQVRYMKQWTDGLYFADSSIGNNKQLLTKFCMRVIPEKIKWYANIRVNQVDEALLKLMWRAGCRLLLYGFESGSQRVLDLMNKGVDVADNYRIAELHNKLKFPYNASVIVGYPGERPADIKETIKFLRRVKPPAIGINRYRLIPGSSDWTNGRQPEKIPNSLYYQMLCTNSPRVVLQSIRRQLGF